MVPEQEQRQILSVSFSSQKYPGRAPAGQVLLRIFLGGSARPEMLEKPDDEIKSMCSLNWRICSACVDSQNYSEFSVGRRRCPNIIWGIWIAWLKSSIGSGIAGPATGRQRLSRRRHSLLHPQRRTSRGEGSGRGEQAAGSGQRAVERTRIVAKGNVEPVGNWRGRDRDGFTACCLLPAVRLRLPCCRDSARQPTAAAGPGCGD